MPVVLSERAQRDFEDLPLTMKSRVAGVFERLERWPNVSGAKQLSADWKGFSRIRTGDWRIIFRVAENEVVIERIAHRREVYE